MKLNVLLAKADHSASSYNSMLRDYAAFFQKNQGSFRGEKKTYQARDGFSDEPSMRGNTPVITTIDEKWDWFIDNAKPYLQNVFDIDATNSVGAAKVELVYEGVSFGKLSAIELMRLKNILTSSDLEKVFVSIPTRSEGEVWEKATDASYVNRAIVQTEMLKGVKRTTQKREEILPDPNIAFLKDTSRYTPMKTVVDTVLEIGDYTQQKFSGEWTQVQRAELLKRRSGLLGAVIAALKEVNDLESVKSEFDSDRMLEFLIKGK